MVHRVVPAFHINASDGFQLSPPFDHSFPHPAKNPPPNHSFSISGKVPAAVGSKSARGDTDPRCVKIRPAHSGKIPSFGHSRPHSGKNPSFDHTRPLLGKVPAAVGSISARDDTDPMCGKILSFDRAFSHLDKVPSAADSKSARGDTDTRFLPPSSVVPSVAHLCSVLASSLSLSNFHRVWLKFVSEGKLPSPQKDRALTRHFSNAICYINNAWFIISGCPRCATHSALLVRNVPNSFLAAANLSPANSPLFTIVSLTDCANVYSDVISIQPRRACRITKINLSFISDSASHWVLSFIDAGANVSDVGTKCGGNTKAFPPFMIYRPISNFIFRA